MPKRDAQLRYLVDMRVATNMPLHSEANELQRTVGVTVEEALVADVVGLPVTVDFNDKVVVGTVISSNVSAKKRAWTVTVAACFNERTQVDLAEKILGPGALYGQLAPAMKIVHGNHATGLVKSITSFSFVQSSLMAGSCVVRAKRQRQTFAAAPFILVTTI